MRTADGALERRHADGGPGARHTDIEMPPDLELPFGDELTVNQRMHFFEGRTMVHWYCCRSVLPVDALSAPKVRAKCFTGRLASGRAVAGGVHGNLFGRGNVN